MGNGKSKEALEPKVVKEEKVQETIDFSRLFKPKEEKVSTENKVVEAVKPKNKQEASSNFRGRSLQMGEFSYMLFLQSIKREEALDNNHRV